MLLLDNFVLHELKGQIKVILKIILEIKISNSKLVKTFNYTKVTRTSHSCTANAPLDTHSKRRIQGPTDDLTKILNL